MRIILFSVLVSSLIQTYCFQEFSNEWLVETTASEEESKILLKKHGFTFINKVEDGLFIVRHQTTPTSSRRRADTVRKRFLGEEHVKFAEQQVWNKRVLKSITVNDAQWNNMWYLNGKTSPDMGVQKAWENGYTGKGIAIAIVDDGVEIDHPDLQQNYRPQLSRDVYDRDSDPSPSPGAEHGTQCAGIALSTKNNLCVVGIAYNCNLAAVRMIGPTGSTDTMEHDALLMGGIDIYSNSWGTQERITFEEPSDLVKSALQKGTKEGRNGLGSIYVWAAGNGGDDDNCNCDGFVNSIYTIGISSVSMSHQPPAYAEPCSAILASTYSGAGGTSDNICTTFINKTCVTNFSGTSAATPMAAGILALVLEANPQLTWRDIQHLIVDSSDVTSLKYDTFQKNGAGHNVSEHFGYGLLKTEQLIETAKNWTTALPQRKCRLPSTTVKRQIYVRDSNRTISSSINTDACNATDYEVLFLEHVQVYIKYKYSLRGAVMFDLISPSGTKSKLLTRRSLDIKANDEQEWTFMSVQFWDENPLGNWTLQMSLKMDWGEIGELTEWYLTFFGTTLEDHYPNTTTRPPDNSPNKFPCVEVIGGSVGGIVLLVVIVGICCRKKISKQLKDCYRWCKKQSTQLQVCSKRCKNKTQPDKMPTNPHYQKTKIDK